jgi:hypothetical protein
VNTLHKGDDDDDDDDNNNNNNNNNNNVSTLYSVAAIPRVLLMVHITLSSVLNSLVLLH